MSFRDNSGPGSQDQPRKRNYRSYPEALWSDVKFGYRMLLKSPSFTVVAIFTLALGIGANTAIFSLLNAVMLQSIPVRDPSQLFVARWSSRQRPNAGTHGYGDCGDFGRPRPDAGGCSFSYPMFKEFLGQAAFFSGVAAFAGPARIELSGDGPGRLAQAELVSGDFFETLGIGAAQGRILTPADEQPGAPPVVALSYPFWQRNFGGAANVVGKTIRLNGTPSLVIAIIDPSFNRLTPGKSPDLWLPLNQMAMLGGEGSYDESSWWLTVLVRLKPHIPPREASTAMALLFRNETMHGSGKPAFAEADDPNLVLLPAQKGLVGIRATFGEPLYSAMAAVAIVLLIACANVAGLLLARAQTRRGEIAVRLALGASRARLMHQLLTESLLLSLTAAALGAILAYWGVTAMSAYFNDNAFSVLNVGLHPDARILFIAIVIAVSTGVAFGLAPAFRGTRMNAAPTLKANTPGFSSSGIGRRNLGNFLVVGQVALSVVVLIAAGLLLRTVGTLRKIEPGFDPQNILLFSVNPALAGYKPEAIRNLYGEMQQRLSALPGVTSVSYSSDRLLQNSVWTTDIKFPGQSTELTLESQILAVGANFFETMRIPLLQGRTIHSADFASAQHVVVVNQAFVHTFLKDHDPIGVRFEQDKQQREIVGVVADTKYEDLRKVNLPIVYLPLAAGSASFALRSALPSSALIPAVKRTVAEMDNDLPVFSVRTQSQTIDRLLFNESLLARVSSLFGVLALGLTCIGLYGLITYQVAQRTREFGVRIALGAQRHNILRLVLTHGLNLAVVGVLIGVVSAAALTRYLQSLLFGVNATDPITFCAVALLLSSVSTLACYLPARRATRVDPMVALRYE